MAAKELNKDQVNELLYQALETEVGGVQVYKTALRCAVNEDLKEEWQKYLEQTQNHERVMRELFEKMGLDPEAMIAVRGVSYCGQLQLRVRGEFR